MARPRRSSKVSTSCPENPSLNSWVRHRRNDPQRGRSILGSLPRRVSRGIHIVFSFLDKGAGGDTGPRRRCDSDYPGGGSCLSCGSSSCCRCSCSQRLASRKATQSRKGSTRLRELREDSMLDWSGIIPSPGVRTVASATAGGTRTLEQCAKKGEENHLLFPTAQKERGVCMGNTPLIDRDAGHPCYSGDSR